MQDPAFTAPGRFWRGNLHTHSNRSDGVLTPEEVCRRYRDEGYDFIALTDHFIGVYDYPIVDTVPFRTENFTTILGAEVHSGAMENGELWHILAVGLPPDFAPPNAPHFSPVDGMETGPDLARRCRDAAAFVAIAHPEWGGLSLADARSLDAAHAVEIYNHGCQVGADRAEGFWHLDRLLEEGRTLTLCATDDAHFSEPDHFGGWTMVKAEANTPEALLAALKAGHMYASTGPLIHDVVWGARSVTVRCSPAASVIVQGRGSATSAVHGHAMAQVELPLGRVSESDWMRLTVMDAAGKRAWTNPVWKDT
ncbi:CehA/McbA family metallohydrolase [uncultured Tateyamaria sp.]|uniref:CehA/McbA family metallohydrolase n=1 Tax=uncultured Tateyamaria sp. TaxID=455651 RepID=UPI002629600B|nr:CehA/McbA family metallohydrolase [uncultured Tateyamaria sp.]